MGDGQFGPDLDLSYGGGRGDRSTSPWAMMSYQHATLMIDKNMARVVHQCAQFASKVLLKKLL